MDYIVNRPCGMVIYLRQEGRGIGLTSKLESIQLGLDVDTFERNGRLGLPGDARGYSTAAELMLTAGIEKVELISESPYKRSEIERHGVMVGEMISLSREMSPCGARELLAKRYRGYNTFLSREELMEIVRTRPLENCGD